MTYFLALIIGLLPTYLIRFAFFGVPTTLLEIIIITFLFATLFQFKPDDFKKIKSLGKINYAIGLFILAGIVSTIVSPDKIKALGQLKAFIAEPVLLFYACVVIIKTKQQLDIVLRFLLATAGIISLFGLIQYVTYIHLPLRFWGTGTEVERITSFFDYPNALALFLAPLIGFYFTLWLKKYDLRLKKYLLPVCLAIMSLALVLTFSRGALFAVILIVLYLLVQEFGATKVLPVTFVAGIILVLIPSVQQRIKLGISDPSSSAHFDLWQIGIQKIVQNPIFGNGLGGFATLNQGVNYPHNIFLNFWLETGLLGLISFSWIIILAWQKAKASNTLTLASGVFLLIMVLHGLVDVPYFKNDLSVLFWFVISTFYI